MEEAFFRFEVEVVKLRYTEDVVNCTLVISKVSAGGDANVVHVDLDCRAKRFMLEDDIAVDEIHHGFERCWRVGESKIHNRRFKKSVSGFKCCLLLISLADAYVVITPSHIKFGIDVRVA